MMKEVCDKSHFNIGWNKIKNIQANHISSTFYLFHCKPFSLGYEKLVETEIKIFRVCRIKGPEERVRVRSPSRGGRRLQRLAFINLVLGGTSNNTGNVYIII